MDHGARVNLKALIPVPLAGGGIVHTCMSILGNMRSEDFSVVLIAPRARPAHRSDFVRTILPRFANWIPWRHIAAKGAERTERALLDAVDNDDVTYLFSNVSLRTTHALRDRGITIVREKTNAHKQTAKDRLDAAFERAGLPPNHGITDEMIAADEEELQLVDFVFCASPQVRMSMVENGVPENKVIESSYGWDQSRLSGTDRLLQPIDGITVVFAGDICVGKGANLLLQAWQRAGIRGRLVMAGRVEPAFAHAFADLLDQETVVLPGFVKDVGALYRSADVFAFPSHTEGGPLVTYEAMACGVPAITSPMGTGAILEDGRGGFVVDPFDIDGWVTALQRLASDEELRREFGDAARERAAQFTWAKVGAGRRRELQRRIAGVANALTSEQ